MSIILKINCSEEICVIKIIDRMPTIELKIIHRICEDA